MDSDSNRHIVKVMSQDRKQLHATLMAIPYYSNRPPDDPQVRFLETPAANGVAASNAIKIWFYPGNSIGHEFIWPRDKAMQLAKATGQPVLTTKTEEESSELMRVDSTGAEAAVAAEASATETQPAPEPQREQIGALATPPAEPAPTPEPRVAPAPAPEPAPRSDLPSTAGVLPLLALMGLGSMAGSRLLRRGRQ